MKHSERSAEETVFESELKKQDLADGKKPDTSKAELDLKKMPHPGRGDQYGVPHGRQPSRYPMLQPCFRPVLLPGQKEQRV